MNTKRWSMITAAFILVVGLGTGAAAQRKSSQISISPPQPIEQTVTLNLNAVEVSDGMVALDPKFGETVFGYGFLGRTTGELPGSFMFSMNCAPAVFTPGGANDITGGSWTLPVYMLAIRGGYAGSLYGTVVNGTMNWSKDGLADVFMTFNVDGGTQVWKGVTGYGTFAGTVTNEKGTTTMSGVLTITYTSVN